MLHRRELVDGADVGLVDGDDQWLVVEERADRVEERHLPNEEGAAGRVRKVRTVVIILLVPIVGWCLLGDGVAALLGDSMMVWKVMEGYGR